MKKVFAVLLVASLFSLGGCTLIQSIKEAMTAPRALASSACNEKRWGDEYEVYHNTVPDYYAGMNTKPKCTIKIIGGKDTQI